MTETAFLLEAKNLRVGRGGTLLLDIPSLKIQSGESLALIGPNGAGKTTLMHALSYLLQPFEGEVWFKGEKVQSRDSILAYRRKLATVFQEPLLFDTTVFKNIASGLKIRGMKQSAIDEIVGQHLEIFGIGHLRDRSARTLSGGEAQRTTLARALAVSPEILFLDEPFSALDPPTRESLIEDLEKILRDTHTTTIFATHDRLEALRLSDRLAIMNKGKIHQIGSPPEVMNQPVDEFVASFVGIETILTGKVVQKNGGGFIVAIHGQKIEAVGEVELGESIVFCIRPENVTLTMQPQKESTSARNLFAGKIEKIVPLGLFYKVQLDCGFPLVSYITGHSLENLSLQEGKEVSASFKATSIHVVRRKSE
jgi:tungstate transport system ATP-binding protein